MPAFSHATPTLFARNAQDSPPDLPHTEKKSAALSAESTAEFSDSVGEFSDSTAEFSETVGKYHGGTAPLGKHTGKPPRNVAGVPPAAEAGGTRRHIVGPNLREPYPIIRNMAGIFPKSGSPVCFHFLMLRVLIHSLSVVMPAATHNRVRGAQAWQMSAKSLALR